MIYNKFKPINLIWVSWLNFAFCPNPGPTEEIIHKGRILHDYVMQHS